MTSFIRGYREFMCAKLEESVEPWAKEYVRPAFDGDPKAAFSLCAALGNENRGAVAVVLWRSQVQREAFRRFFASAWDHDHKYVIAAAGTRRSLAAMFRYAAFPLPDELPERVRVWRGTSGMTFSQARAGYSWTTSRDVACWFAMRWAEQTGRPLVLVAEVSRGDIALFHNERDEHEAVLLRQPVGVAIDGVAADWLQCFDRHCEWSRKENLRDIAGRID